MHSRLKLSVLAALAAGLTAISSWINIPLFFTPVPINMALLGPYTAGLLLGVRYGVRSQLVYILLGAVGIPVFSGFTSGIGVLAGPTGGFILGYIPCAAICGLAAKKKSFKQKILLMICGLMTCYFFGIARFMHVTGSSARAGLISCVLPFIPGDAIKLAVAALLSKRLSKAL